MRVAITGAAGFIGSQVADAYVAAGHEVLVIDDLSSGVRAQVPRSAQFVQCDIRSPEAARAVSGFRPDVFNHHAAQIDVRKSVDDVAYDADVNLRGMLNVVEAARKAGAKRVVFASSGGAIYGETPKPADERTPVGPASPYGVAKAASELYLGAFDKMYGLHWVALRYANIYGQRQNAHGEAGVVAIFSDRLLSGRPCTIYGDGSATRDFVHVSDVVAANVAALDCAFKGPVNIGTGVETSVLQLYRLIAKAAGSKLEPTHADGKVGDIAQSCLDASLAAKVLSWKPKVAVADGIAQTVAWFKAQGKK